MINWLVTHLHPVNVSDLVLLLLNGVTCTSIAMLVALPASIPGEYKSREVTITRFVIAAVYALIGFRVWSGRYLTPVEPTELVANVAMLIQAGMVRGDVGVWFDVYTELRARRRAALDAHRAWKGRG